jgi:hypothetical protein
MEVDSDDEKYLATGDVKGFVKIWNIENYCRNLHLRTSKNIEMNPRNYWFCFCKNKIIQFLSRQFNLAPLVTIIKAHTDLICSINFCHKYESVLVIIGSSDRRVSLHNIFGTQIGVFGQPDLWKIKLAVKLIQVTPETTNEYKNSENNNKKEIFKNDFNLSESFTESVKKNENKLLSEREIFVNDSQNYFDIPGFTTSADFGLVKKLNARLNFEDTFNYEKEAFVKNPTLRYNPWSKTLLGIALFFKSILKIFAKWTGRSYQEARIRKRDRRQPGYLATDKLLFWEKIDQTPGGIYGVNF